MTAAHDALFSRQANRYQKLRQPAHHLAEHTIIERLDQIRRRTELIAALDLGRVVGGRHDKHGNAREHLIALQALQDLETTQPWHVQVGDDRDRIARLALTELRSFVNIVEQLLAILEINGAVAEPGALHVATDQRRVSFIVLANQNARRDIHEGFPAAAASLGPSVK